MTMGDCQKLLSSIYAYLDNECSPDDISSIKEHIRLCRECFERLDFERLLREHMKKKTDHCCPDRVKARISKIMETF